MNSMPTHFIDVLVEPAIAPLIYARVLAVVHQSIQSGHALRVCWPEWSNRQFGGVMRVFGDSPTLALVQDALKRLADRSLVRLYGPMTIPVTTNGFVVARRTRPDATRRYHVADKYQATASDARMTKASVHKDAYLMLSSQSTGQQYSLFIDQVATDADATLGGGRSYGLGLPCPRF